MHVCGLRGFLFRLCEAINMTKPYGCNPDYTMKLRENYGNLPDAIELLTVVCVTHIALLDVTMCCKKTTQFILFLDEESRPLHLTTVK